MQSSYLHHQKLESDTPNRSGTSREQNRTAPMTSQQFFADQDDLYIPLLARDTVSSRFREPCYLDHCISPIASSLKI